jgi:hypothetical protein
LCGPWFKSRQARIQGVWTISRGDRPDFEEVIKQALPTIVGSLVGLNRPAVNVLSSTAMKIYGISYGRGRGSTYSACTGNTAAICPIGAKIQKTDLKKKYMISITI